MDRAKEGNLSVLSVFACLWGDIGEECAQVDDEYLAFWCHSEVSWLYVTMDIPNRMEL